MIFLCLPITIINMDNNKTPKQVEENLAHFFEKYGIQKKVTVEDIKKWIWNSTGPVMEASQKYQKKCFNLIPRIDDIDELNNVIKVVTDAWNFFPHKALDGKSPHQMYIETYGEKVEKQPLGKQKMPKIVVGGKEMEVEEFQAMIKKMENEQRPFKKWIEEDALPKYQRYLEQIMQVKKACEEHYDVADIFFQRALHVGFLNLGSIRPEFIKNEFSRWWPTHVMYSNLTPEGVKKSLGILFEFIELVYSVRK